MENRPNRIRHSARIPSACQNVIAGRPKSGGSSQFHRARTTPPPAAMNTAAPTRNIGANITNLLARLAIIGFSPFPEFVVEVLQPFAQPQHRISLPREQRVHALTGLGGHLLEAASFQLVPHENLALLVRQLLD